MKRSKVLTHLLPALSFMGLAACVLAQTPAEERIEKGVTAPSKRVELAFPYQGIIEQVNVKEGDTVQAKQVLMSQDGRIERKRLEALSMEADRSWIIAAREATLANKKIEAQRTQEMFDRQAKSESELLQAKLEVKLAEAELEQAKIEQKTKVAEKELQEVRLTQMNLLSPIDGIVEKLEQSEGEVADIDRHSIVVVKNDPLDVEIKTLPIKAVEGLTRGQELQVRYPGEEWRPAKLTFIAPEADKRAGTHPIRLEMPNPEGRWTGKTVEVKIPSPPETASR